MNEPLRKPSVVSLVIPVGLIAWGVYRLGRVESTFWRVAWIGVVVMASIDLVIKLGAMYFGRGKGEVEAEHGRPRQAPMEPLEDRSSPS